MAKKKKKLVKRPNIVFRILRLLARFIHWITILAMRGSRKNPLLAFGLALFFVTFSYVSYNALFRQASVDRPVFFETRNNTASQKSQTIDDLINQDGQTVSEVDNTTASPASIPVNSPVSTASTVVPMPKITPSSKVDPELKAVQKKLSDLGIYDGEIDGIGGPKTRLAIEKWQKLQQTIRDNKSIQTGNKGDNIKQVIQGNNDRKSIDQAAKTASVKTIPEKNTVFPDSDVNIIRVQSALRAFGMNDVVINGQVDENTRKAILKFQKMFSLDETGKADTALFVKMQEIGLLQSNSKL